MLGLDVTQLNVRFGCYPVKFEGEGGAWGCGMCSGVDDLGSVRLGLARFGLASARPGLARLSPRRLGSSWLASAWHAILNLLPPQAALKNTAHNAAV